MFHVAYFSGAHPLNGDSGGPVGSGPTLLGLVDDIDGNTSKVLHLTDIYGGASWSVPGRH